MNESLRQDYLGALGIDVWYAQVTLPGAAPSPDFSWDKSQDRSRPEASATAPQPSNESNSSVSPAPEKGKSERPRLVEALSQPDTRAERSSAKSQKPDKAEATVQGSPEQEPVVNESFNLGLWVGSRWVLIADWQKEASAELQHRLANNILGAMGDSPEARPGRLLWPAFSHPEIPGRSAGNLHAALRQVLGAVPGASLNFIVLGVQSGKLTAYGSWLETTGIQVCQPFTLADMAADSQLKRQLWESLQEVSRKR